MSNHISKIELSFLYIFFFFLYPFYIELLEAIVVKVYQAAEIEYVGLIKKKISMQRIISLTFLFTMDLSFFFTCIIGYQENTKRNENKIYFWVNRRIVSFFFFFLLFLIYIFHDITRWKATLPRKVIIRNSFYRIHFARG